jgi:hypothetical protein
MFCVLTHEQKQAVLKGYARAYQLRTFIESGACDGLTVQAMAPVMDRVISVELDASKYLHCWRMFINEPKVTIIHGDSGDVLESLLRFFKPEATLFWLDGHWNSGFERGPKDTPIQRELEHIAYHSPRDHVILIDDARLFGVEKDYPSVDWVVEFVMSRIPDGYDYEVRDDIMRFTPR